jgi:hypothetical protein
MMMPMISAATTGAHIHCALRHHRKKQLMASKAHVEVIMALDVLHELMLQRAAASGGTPHRFNRQFNESNGD